MARAKKKASKKSANHGKAEEMTLDQIIGGKGFEDATSDAYAIPFLRILQKLSPEVDKDDEAFVKGAKPGMIFHTVSNTVHESVTIVPIKFTQSYIEWVPRTAGGGFRGEYVLGTKKADAMLATTTLNERNIPILPNGNEFKRHANYYCALEIGNDVYEPVMISMSSSQLTTSRKWMTQMKQATLELAGRTVTGLNMDVFKWKLSTQLLENDKGKWYGWVCERVTHNLLLEDESKPTYLPAVKEQSDFIHNAIQHNLLTYDRDQQQADAVATEENAL